MGGCECGSVTLFVGLCRFGCIVLLVFALWSGVCVFNGVCLFLILGVDLSNYWVW